MQKEILNIPGLEILEDSVEDLIIEPISNHPGRAVTGVCLGKEKCTCIFTYHIYMRLLLHDSI